MIILKLSSRLQTVYELIPKNSIIVDIGTDHGYIPVIACTNGICPTAIATDIAAGPLSAAIENIKKNSLAEKIDCRLGNGLACVQSGEADGAVICGMGGSMIIQILTDSPKVIDKFKFLILQPMNAASSLRRFIYKIGWHINDEQLVAENNHLYEIIRAVPGATQVPEDCLYEIGPINWQRKNDLLQLHLQQILEKHKKIEAGLALSHHPSAEKLVLARTNIKVLEEKLWQLNCKK